MDKECLREQIAIDTEEFISQGGVIEIVPRVPFCPANMQWALDRGFDYSHWSRQGDVDFFSGKEELDSGCYLTKPARTEE